MTSFQKCSSSPPEIKPQVKMAQAILLLVSGGGRLQLEPRCVHVVRDNAADLCYQRNLDGLDRSLDPERSGFGNVEQSSRRYPADHPASRRWMDTTHGAGRECGGVLCFSCAALLSLPCVDASFLHSSWSQLLLFVVVKESKKLSIFKREREEYSR